MYHGAAAFSSAGASVLGLSVGSEATATGHTLPFTGLPFEVVNSLLVAFLLIALGVAMVRLGKLGIAERSMAAPRFPA